MNKNIRKRPWFEWKKITRRIVEQKFDEWPEAIMLCYYKEGLSPLEALDRTAYRKRMEASNIKVRG